MNYLSFAPSLLSDIFNKFKLLCKELNIVITHEDILTIDRKINYLDTKEVEITYFKRYTIIDLDNDKESKYFDILACAKNTDIAKAKGSAETYFNFQKNSWWNKKNHQPGLKFDFI
ncbi:hypothetical protein [Spiroplasma endosymbiont of Zeiraphera isertana]|uniref:hypothetical protein n=1 Tax=Spiroplasma endosymbiont of Zeiraphera isertana TaxID=3066313 RepID=UPI00313DC283